MKYYTAIIMLLTLFSSCNENHKDLKTTEMVADTPINFAEQKATYFLIRHAEKDRSNPKNPNPNLNIDGLKRAQGWATYFEPFQIDQVYVTKYIRTKQTISLIAQQKMLNPILYDPRNLQLDEFLKETNGKNVLVVGHSNTIPTFINDLIGEDKFTEMDDTDNSTLFKVTIDGNDKKVETIKVE